MSDYEHPIEYRAYDTHGDLVLYLYTSEALEHQDLPSFRSELHDLLESGEDLRVTIRYL